MLTRKPGIRPDQGEINWSKVPEFSSFYNGASVVIPRYEHYLNNVMNEVRENHCDDNPELKRALDIFIEQETVHSRYHIKFNKHMYDAGYESLKEVENEIGEDLREQRRNKSLEYNVAYCAGFESLATFLCKYFFENCDVYLQEGDAEGTNLFLWHLAEEWEHRAVAHDVYHQISGNYFIRVRALIAAFWRVGGSFKRAEARILKIFREGMTEEERKRSEKMSKKVFRRQLLYSVPQMLQILLPWYHPSQLKDPPNIKYALALFESEDAIDRVFDVRQRSRQVGQPT